MPQIGVLIIQKPGVSHHVQEVAKRGAQLRYVWPLKAWWVEYLSKPFSTWDLKQWLDPVAEVMEFGAEDAYILSLLSKEQCRPWEFLVQSVYNNASNILVRRVTSCLNQDQCNSVASLATGSLFPEPSSLSP